MKEKLKLSPNYQKDVNRAVEILKAAGYWEIFLFGSLTTGKAGIKSDIDLAVRGCPPEKFFHLLGKLLMELNHPVDLVDLDNENAFARYLEKNRELIKIS
jgi:predicted nucleotidyltransferase